MKVTVVPASTRTGFAVIRSLLFGQPPNSVQVEAVFRDTGKAPTEFQTCANFKAIEGDVSDVKSLDFSGSDCVLAITPPVCDGRDIVEHALSASRNVKMAIEAAGTVRRLVLLSSIGAQFDQGVGELKTNNRAEQVFSGTNIPEIIFARCAYFMENWINMLSLGEASQPFFTSTITPTEWEIPMIAVKDIGTTLASDLTSKRAPANRPYIYNLQGPRWYSSLDVQSAFSKALGKHIEMKSIAKQDLHAFYARIFPPQILDDWVEMNMSFLPGGIATPDKIAVEENTVRGPTSLAEAIKESVEAMRD